MGRETLARKLEDWAIATAKGSGALGDLQIVHGDDTAKAKPERLVFEATIGAERLDVKAVLSSGEIVQGFDAELKIELRSTNRDAEQFDSVFAAVETAFIEDIQAGLIGFCGQLFNEFVFLPENMEQGEVTRSGKSRTRSRTYPFIVSEKGLTPAIAH